MRPRQNLVDIFSTFAQFEAEQFSRWLKEPSLRRSMQSLTQSLPTDKSETFWELYWYKVWQAQPSHRWARSHLIAYLQEPCYWAAQKAVSNFSQTQYTVSDCFQVAIAQIEKVFKGFNLDRGFSLKNYASTIFANVIRENFRQRQEVDICTPWALLRKVSQKRLTESLELAGLNSDTIARYILAWKSFKTLYVPSEENTSVTRKLQKPEPSILEAIAALYNQERPATEAKCTPATLEQWLLNCAQATRSYLYPNLTSINAPTAGQEFGELQDYLPGSESESLLADAIAKEEEQARLSQQTQLNEVLNTALTKIEPEGQQLLQLYYCGELTQQQIAKQLDIKQYTVSRRLTKARQSLLLTLAQWTQDTLHISLTSDVLNDISNLLEEWLAAHYTASKE
jgi:RNA polymerase sigma factor (sigma-70 family)